jgi:orotate phosphoribosyltransferase
MKPLFESGQFKLHSGDPSSWRINAEMLTDEDLATLAGLPFEANLIGPVSGVEGVPTGGLRFAEAIRQYATIDKRGPLLIVDDVLTTGDSMEKQRAGRDAIGVVIFARGTPPPWVEAVWYMSDPRL